MLNILRSRIFLKIWSIVDTRVNMSIGRAFLLIRILKVLEIILVFYILFYYNVNLGSLEFIILDSYRIMVIIWYEHWSFERTQSGLNWIVVLLAICGYIRRISCLSYITGQRIYFLSHMTLFKSYVFNRWIQESHLRLQNGMGCKLFMSRRRLGFILLFRICCWK